MRRHNSQWDLKPVNLFINELVFADDTLVVATGPCRAETQMRFFATMGMQYGLRLRSKEMYFFF